MKKRLEKALKGNGKEMRIMRMWMRRGHRKRNQ